MSLYPLKFKPRYVEKIWGGRKLESVLGKVRPPVHLTPATTDRAQAADWFDRFEGAGLDGVIAKRLDAARPNERHGAERQPQRRRQAPIEAEGVNESDRDREAGHRRGQGAQCQQVTHGVGQ